MTTPTIPTQRRSPENTVDFCPTCNARTRSCAKPACIRAEIDDIVRLDRNEEACDDDD